jgi:glycosyltransferase involved in cell wall biosynthesis
MKLLHIIGSVNPEKGGPIEGVIKSAEVWTRLGHQREIVSLDRPSDPWVATCPVHTFALGSPGTEDSLWRKLIPWLRYGYSPRLVPWLRQHAHEYDAVIVNGLWNYSALGALRGLRGSGVPYFVFTHGMLDPWFKKTYPIKNLMKQVFWWFSEGPLLRGARAVLFTTEEECLTARAAFRPYRLTERVVGYGTADAPGERATQVENFLQAFPQLRGRRFLLFLSRIHQKKGCDLLISAFVHHAAQHPDLDLVMAGPDQVGWRAALEKLAQREGIAHRIIWPGMLSGDLKWGAFHAAEAFVLPSHQENFGIVVAEAMACGKPVLISDKVNIWREILAAGAGLVAPDDAEHVRDLLGRFLQLPADEKDRMARAARQCFLDKFEIEQAAVGLLATISEAVGHKSPA